MNSGPSAFRAPSRAERPTAPEELQLQSIRRRLDLLAVRTGAGVEPARPVEADLGAVGADRAALAEARAAAQAQAEARVAAQAQAEARAAAEAEAEARVAAQAEARAAAEAEAEAEAAQTAGRLAATLREAAAAEAPELLTPLLAELVAKREQGAAMFQRLCAELTGELCW